MRRRGTFISVLATLACTLMACMVLVGCSGMPGGGSPKANKADFVGTWDAVRVNAATKDDSVSEEDMELMRSLGLDMFLNLDDDDSAHLVAFGETADGTWAVGTSNSITITIDGESITATLENGELSLKEGDTTMVFKKGDAKETPSGNTSGSIESITDDVESDAEQKTAIEPAATIADDSICTIKVTAKGVDWASDPGYYLTITNNSDKVISISTQSSSFSVNGKMISPVLWEEIKPGAYAEAFMYFDDQEVGGGVEKLVAVEGTLEAYDPESYETLATYAFNM